MERLLFFRTNYKKILFFRIFDLVVDFTSQLPTQSQALADRVVYLFRLRLSSRFFFLALGQGSALEDNMAKSKSYPITNSKVD